MADNESESGPKSKDQSHVRTEVQLSPEECAAFGVTPEQAKTLCTWVMERVGYVLGSTGRGGSGVFVETTDGHTALLTARHVLIPAILSGEVTVAHYLTQTARSVEPSAVRIAARADAALVFVPDGLVPARLSPQDWNPDTEPSVTSGQGVIAAGAPSEWKTEPDLARRVIQSARTLLFWTAVTNPNAQGYVVCDVNEKITSMPSTFRGMSGGPVFDTNRQLVGVNKGEQRGMTDGKLFATPRRAWQDLYVPFMPTKDMPTDYMHQVAGMPLLVRHEDAPPSSDPVLASFLAEYFWSLSNPEHRYGEFGRIIAIVFGHTPVTTRYKVNVESAFFLPQNHTEETRGEALREEAVFMLEEMRYRVVSG